MKKITRETLQESANKLMIHLSEEEIDNLLNDFYTISKFAEKIAEVPGVDDVEPMFFPFVITSDHLREDVASAPLSKEEVLKNASDIKDGQICGRPGRM